MTRRINHKSYDEDVHVTIKETSVYNILYKLLLGREKVINNNKNTYKSTMEIYQ